MSWGFVVGDVGGEWGGEIDCLRITFVKGGPACALAAALGCSLFICRSSSEIALLKLFVRLAVLVLVGVVGFVGSGFVARLNRFKDGVVGVGLCVLPSSLSSLGFFLLLPSIKKPYRAKTYGR